MQDDARSDAQLLWDDALDIIEHDEEGAINQALLAMLRSCQPTAVNDTTLFLTCSGSFVARKVGEFRDTINRCVSEAAFQPIEIEISVSQDGKRKPVEVNNVVSTKEYLAMGGSPSREKTTSVPVSIQEAPFYQPKASFRSPNPLLDTTFSPNKFTFDRFVEGEGNTLALQAAKQVANGTKAYNPLFIYGNSGLGKTHLLRAIQNYIYFNEPERTCIYKTGKEFFEDYVSALKVLDRDENAVTILEENYRDIDILIVDDFQLVKNTQGTMDFFFNIFNHLQFNGKQVVVAADRSPAGLQEEKKVDVRLTSRFDAGVTLSIQAPNYELKYALIKNFCTQQREDARREGLEDLDADIPDDMIEVMADKAGSNIRIIEGFCHLCLMKAHQRELEGSTLAESDITRIAREKWPTGQKIITVEQIQSAVESYYGISHNDLIGSKRSKEFMEPRHIAIWLTREMTDNTLADIGKKFGNRTHATVKHSIRVVEDMQKDDRLLKDRIDRIEEKIVDPDS